MTTQIDISANRRTRNWSGKAQVARICWALCQPFFRLSPRPLWFWRVWLLRLFGAQIGQGVHVYPSVRITMPWHLYIEDQAAIGDRAILYALGPIHIGPRATVSQNAHLCAGSHDWRDPARPLLRPPIVIGPDAWVCADAFVGPGVVIGAGSILGARAVALRALPPRHIGQGNPMVVRPMP
ncbi:MAG: acetyltransferase [Loktanella sp.]|nr:acetyltransferase [Loktanella sp.]